MLPLTATEIAQATNGTIYNKVADDLLIDAVCTDSRNITDGCLFIALEGELFDAHQFIEQAAQAGAAALLVHQKIESKLPCILVKDTRIALGLLSAYVKRKISGLKCAAITGSNGKTTTKEFLSQILQLFSPAENSVLATAGNFNNDIGLPLTLLRLSAQSRFAVVELGANHQGEIAYTAQLAKPDVALINNVMPAHLEGFGSLEGVAKAKGEIWESLTADGCAVVNLDANFANEYLQQLLLANTQTVTFSQSDTKADVFASQLQFDALGKATFTLNIRQDSLLHTTEIHLNLAGKHNVSNALAAASMASALGCGIEVIARGLNLLTEVSGRVNSCRVNESVTVIDDTYNANSASVKAAIDLLVQTAGKHLLILADMAELGEYSEQEHREIGVYAAQQGIQQLLTVGKATMYTAQSFTANGGNTAQHFADKQQLGAYLQKVLLQNSEKLSILVKGSRSAKMEKVVSLIKQTVIV